MNERISVNEDKTAAKLCRKSFYEFVKEFWSTIIQEPPVWNWHIRYICDEMQKVAERVFVDEPREYDLIINIPPGTSKSTIVSQMFPAWVWTRMPTAKFICCSYAKDVAMKDSIRTRDIVQSELYERLFPGIGLREDENTKHLFINKQGGFRLAAGTGGAITGYHGHFLIVDDPLNPEEAVSALDRKAAWRWMEGTLPTRKTNKAVSVTILVQQRLHQADPSGEMLDKTKGEGVKHINLPGRLSPHVSPPEIATNYVDGLLDPVRLSEEVLKNMEKEMGAYSFAAQIGQHPVPLGGGLFKVSELKYVIHVPPYLVRLIRSWDKAGTDDAGCWSVGVLIGVDRDGMYWFLDVIRGQWSATKRNRIMRQTTEDDGDDVEVMCEIEGGSGGKESGQQTRRDLAGYRIHLYHPTGDKESRAYALASQVGGGNVGILKGAWNKEFVNEMEFFPHSKFMDQIDAASSGFSRIAKKKRIIGAVRQKAEER